MHRSSSQFGARAQYRRRLRLVAFGILYTVVHCMRRMSDGARGYWMPFFVVEENDRSIQCIVRVSPSTTTATSIHYIMVVCAASVRPSRALSWSTFCQCRRTKNAEFYPSHSAGSECVVADFWVRCANGFDSDTTDDGNVASETVCLWV